MDFSLLEHTETQTPDARVLCGPISGTLKIQASMRKSISVTLQIKAPDDEEWHDYLVDGSPIVFERWCLYEEVFVMPFYKYRVVAEKAGPTVKAAWKN